jgi:hypothetical protein
MADPPSRAQQQKQQDNRPRFHVFRSTAIASAEWDPVLQSLEVTFANGSSYTYDNVPEAEFEAFTKAPSAGQYFKTNIKDRY